MIETDALLGVSEVPLGRAGAAVVSADLPEEASRVPRPSAPVVETDDAPTSAPCGRGEPAIPSATLEGDSQAERLEALSVRHADACVHCVASTTHRNIVFGEGSPEASLMFIGEAPGEHEDRSGRPFVGPAGEKLDQMIKAMGFTREDVYIANVLKTRPPENRTPRPDEAKACGRWLASQIAVIRPKVLVALGGPAAQLLLETETGITRLRGAWGRYEVEDLSIPVMPTFHPAYVLRRYTPDVRAAVWNDLQLARDMAHAGD